MKNSSFMNQCTKVNLHMYYVEFEKNCFLYFPKQMISHSLWHLLCMTKCFECGEPWKIKRFCLFLKIVPQNIGHLIKTLHTSLVILLYMFKIVTWTSVMKWSVYVTGVDVFSCILYIITITIICEVKDVLQFVNTEIKRLRNLWHEILILFTSWYDLVGPKYE